VLGSEKGGKKEKGKGLLLAKKLCPSLHPSPSFGGGIPDFFPNPNEKVERKGGGFSYKTSKGTDNFLISLPSGGEVEGGKKETCSLLRRLDVIPLQSFDSAEGRTVTSPGGEGKRGMSNFFWAA